MHQYVVYTGACLVVVKGNKCAFGISVAAYQHRRLPIGSLSSSVGCFWADACIVCVHMECIQMECGYHYFTCAY